MPTHERIIHQTHFMGIVFYKRTRIEEYEIQINAQQNITEHAGMVVAGREPLTNSSFTSPGSDWKKIALRTIELTLLNLIINDFVELVVFKDTKSYFNDFVKDEYQNYRLAVKNNYRGKDWLSKSIFQSVKFTEQRLKEYALLKDVIDSVIDKYIGGSHAHRQPQRSFIFELIRRYTPDNSWMTSEIRTVFFRERLELKVIPKKQEEFKNAYKMLVQIRKILKQESPAFRRYTNELHQTIGTLFERRKSSK